MAEGRMSSFRLCRRSGVLLSLLLSVISSTNRIAFADVVQRLEHDFLVKPEVKEFDEVSGQYFKADGEHAGCISVFTSSSFLIQENFGCCPGAQGLLVANGNLFVAGDGQICVFKIATLAALDPIGVDSFKGHQLTALDLDKTTNTLWTTSRSGEQDAPPSGQAMVAKIQLDSGEIQISGSPQKQSQSNSSSPRRALAPLGGGAAAQRGQRAAGAAGVALALLLRGAGDLDFARVELDFGHHGLAAGRSILLAAPRGCPQGVCGFVQVQGGQLVPFERVDADGVESC
mmetsp:Transcript_38577/g.83889  ORF Transcript_38577/g.83889 Transcript_38577/m.83889 type:complete len:287 (+) Transcript_38577:375-1235(+)